MSYELIGKIVVWTCIVGAIWGITGFITYLIYVGGADSCWACFNGSVDYTGDPIGRWIAYQSSGSFFPWLCSVYAMPLLIWPALPMRYFRRRRQARERAVVKETNAHTVNA